MNNPPATAERGVLYQRIIEAADTIAHRINRDALAIVYLDLLRRHLPFLSTLTLYHYVEQLEAPIEEPK